MRTKRYIATLALLLVIAAPALAEDGALFVKNISKTPDLETDHATLRVLYQRVRASTSAGELTTVYYPTKDEDGEVESRDYVQPLIAFYHDGHVTYPDDCAAFPGHGTRDVFGAVSLDDGNTWATANLSKSGDKSSFRLKDGTDYPGDTFRLFANSAGNKVLVAWASRLATGGNPNYALSDTDKTALAGYLGIDEDDLYLHDMWGVGGSQKSSDFADEDFPTVGEIPYAVLWAARGTLEQMEGADTPENTDDDKYEIIWRQAERLTSGRRDVHRIEVGVAGKAGFILTWQEDPDGLRPGHGEGPGEGWSGAVAHHETDIWYSYIHWDNYDLVDDAADGWNAVSLAEYNLNENGTPAVAIPFSMPVRLTDNAMGAPIPADYDPAEAPSYLYELDRNNNGIADLCASSTIISVVEGTDADGNPIMKEMEICLAEDGRLMRGNTAATRNRVNLRGYDKDGDDIFDSAWVVMAYEESKGMGEEEDLDPQGLIEKTDMGKNIWYHTFDMFEPELVSQGLMLNMPAVYPEGMPFDYDSPTTSRLVEYPYTTKDGKYSYRFMQIDPDPIYMDQAGLETTLFQSEISRRFSLISQPAMDAGPSGTVALAMWKQGIIRQGGPADVMGRRFVIPEPFNSAEDNPFDYGNMECTDWLFLNEDGSQLETPNPRYVKGLCVSPPKNMSGTSLVEANEYGPSNSVNATVEQLQASFPWNQAFDDIEMGELDSYDGIDLDSLIKIYQWSQSGPNFGDNVTAMDPALTNFDDQSWDNPYDVAKGHRGYISGDYIMMLYCWSPNWLANTRGHDNYNLYVRRSFDGGQTWTTLPAAWTDTQDIPDGVTVEADGTTFYEWMGPAGTMTEYKVPYDLEPGDFEPVRNMSLLNGLKLTVLDPRYAPTGGATHSSILTNGDYLYPDDKRDPSKWFITFEVGDNTTVIDGEATPLDMFYSRASNYGDDFEYVWEDPENPGFDPDSTTNEGYFDWLEGKKDIHAAEAAMSGNPGGTFFWTIWNQWKEDVNENAYDSDAILRRLMFDEDIDDNVDDGGGPPIEPPRPGKQKKSLPDKSPSR